MIRNVMHSNVRLKEFMERKYNESLIFYNELLNKTNKNISNIEMSNNYLNIFNHLFYVLAKKCSNVDIKTFSFIYYESKKNKFLDLNDNILYLSLLLQIITYNEYIEILDFKEVRNNKSSAHLFNSFENQNEYDKNYNLLCNLISKIEIRDNTFNFLVNIEKENIKEMKGICYLLCLLLKNRNQKPKIKFSNLAEFVCDNKFTLFFKFFVNDFIKKNEWMLLNNNIQKFFSHIDDNGVKRIINEILLWDELTHIKLKFIDLIFKFNKIDKKNLEIFEILVNELINFKKRQSTYYEFSYLNKIINLDLFKYIIKNWEKMNKSEIIEYYKWIIECPSGISWSISKFENIILQSKILKNDLKEFILSNRKLIEKRLNDLPVEKTNLIFTNILKTGENHE